MIRRVPVPGSGLRDRSIPRGPDQRARPTGATGVINRRKRASVWATVFFRRNGCRACALLLGNTRSSSPGIATSASLVISRTPCEARVVEGPPLASPVGVVRVSTKAV